MMFVFGRYQQMGVMGAVMIITNLANKKLVRFSYFK